MLLSLMFFDTSFLEIETLCFTSLILVEYMLTISELNRLHIISIAATVISLIIYIFILLVLRNLFDIGDIWKFEYLYKIFAIVMISWFPLFLFQVIKKKVDPSDYEKIMKTVPRGIINTKIK